jgi:hypothetical protein
MASDHVPIETVLMINHTPALTPTRRDYRKTDIELFRKTLVPLLPEIGIVASQGDFDNVMVQVTAVFQTAAEDVYPETKIVPRSIPGFDEECREAIDKVKHTQRQRN